MRKKSIFLRQSRRSFQHCLVPRFPILEYSWGTFKEFQMLNCSSSRAACLTIDPLFKWKRKIVLFLHCSIPKIQLITHVCCHVFWTGAISWHLRSLSWHSLAWYYVAWYFSSCEAFIWGCGVWSWTTSWSHLSSPSSDVLHPRESASLAWFNVITLLRLFEWSHHHELSFSIAHGGCSLHKPMTVCCLAETGFAV